MNHRLQGLRETFPLLSLRRSSRFPCSLPGWFRPPGPAHRRQGLSHSSAPCGARSFISCLRPTSGQLWRQAKPPCFQHTFYSWHWSTSLSLTQAQVCVDKAVYNMQYHIIKCLKHAIFRQPSLLCCL